MIYNGKFRNIDTSVDPLGQQYKVLICTSIRRDGYYPYRYVSTGPTAKPIKVPILPEELELADDPIVVNYESQGEIYKPYKCSTATVRIMLDKIQPEFMCTNKNDILVCLLKWNNNVYKSAAYEMKNKVTGATLKMKRINIPGEIPFYNFVPEDYDKFCYSVEWIGYVTPDTYSQDYNLSQEAFELECQDVFSSLKYYDYTVDQKINRSFSDIISRCAENVDSVYKHVYMTTAIKVPEPANQLVAMGETPAYSILDKLLCDDNNWFDENGEAKSCIDVIENIMQYLGCTLVPYKDSIFITNFDAIGTGQHTYYSYERPQTNNLLIPRGKKVSWVYTGLISAGTEVDIDGKNLALANTQVSTSSTYKKVVLNTDEYYRDHLVIDIDEDDHITHVSDFEALSRVATVREVKHQGTNNAKYEFDDTQIMYQGQILKPNEANIPGRCVMYNYDLDGWDGHNIVPGHIKRPYPTTWGQSTALCGCSLVEFGSNPVSNKTVLADLFTDYNGERFFLFNAPAVTQSDEKTPLLWPSWFHGIAPSISQVMLLLETEEMFMRKDQLFQINGDWTFYNTKFYPMDSGWTSSNNPGLAAHLKDMFVFAKVTVTSNGRTKYLMDTTSTAEGVRYGYKWVDQDTWCRLYYGGQGYNDYNIVKAGSWFWGKDEYKMAGVDAFGSTFSFVKNNRYVDGTVIPVPDFDGHDFVGKLTIAFNRPGGCGIEPGKEPVWGADAFGYYTPQTTTLKNFNVKIIDESEMSFNGDPDGNNNFEVKMNDYATDDYPTINSLLSSNYQRSTNLAAVSVKNGSDVDRVGVIANNGIGEVALPEKLIVDSVARTYKDSNLVLNVVIHDRDTVDDFLNAFTWSSQFPGKTFVPSSMSVNYEIDQVTLTLFERRESRVIDRTAYIATSRNFRRNGDNLFYKYIGRGRTFISGAIQPAEGFRNTTITKDDRGRMIIGGTNPGLIKYATVEPNFETGEIRFSYPDAAVSLSATVKNGDMNIVY